MMSNYEELILEIEFIMRDCKFSVYSNNYFELILDYHFHCSIKNQTYHFLCHHFLTFVLYLKMFKREIFLTIGLLLVKPVSCSVVSHKILFFISYNSYIVNKLHKHIWPLSTMVNLNHAINIKHDKFKNCEM